MTGRIGSIAATALVAALFVPAAAAPAQRRADSAATGTGDAMAGGAAAWDAGNYARAIAVWRPLAAAGDAYAQYNLGQAYRLGRGVAVDKAIAQDWYRKAAQSGHPQAQANYGLMLFDGGDRRGALPWLQKAADQGDPRAQYVVGTALFNGDLAPKDWVRAYALMTRAAAAGLTPARTSLAEMDKYVPLQQRTQGTALARDLGRSAALALADERNADLVGAAPAPTRSEPVTPARPAAAAPKAPARVAESAPAPTRTTPPAPPPVRVAAAPQPIRTARAEAKPVAALKPAAGGGWRVQVGAYGDPAAATRAWAGIAAKTPGLALSSHLQKAGAMTRLQAGPLASRADAAKACARITAASGTACFPVAAN